MNRFVDANQFHCLRDHESNQFYPSSPKSVGFTIGAVSDVLCPQTLESSDL